MQSSNTTEAGTSVSSPEEDPSANTTHRDDDQTEMNSTVRGDDDGINITQSEPEDNMTMNGECDTPIVVRPINTQCAICLEDLNDFTATHVLDGCNHGFHSECIQTWWDTGRIHCPLCNTPDKKREEQRSQQESQAELTRRLARLARVHGQPRVFEILRPTVYCATPNHTTQLVECPVTTVLPGTLVTGERVQGDDFLRVTVVVPDTGGQVYCFLPIRTDGVENMQPHERERRLRSQGGCSCFRLF